MRWEITLMPHSELNLLANLAPRQSTANSGLTANTANDLAIQSDSSEIQTRSSFNQQLNQIRQSREANVAEKGNILPKHKPSTTTDGGIIERKPAERVTSITTDPIDASQTSVAGTINQKDDKREFDSAEFARGEFDSGKHDSQEATLPIGQLNLLHLQSSIELTLDGRSPNSDSSQRVGVTETADLSAKQKLNASIISSLKLTDTAEIKQGLAGEDGSLSQNIVQTANAAALTSSGTHHSMPVSEGLKLEASINHRLSDHQLSTTNQSEDPIARLGKGGSSDGAQATLNLISGPAQQPLTGKTVGPSTDDLESLDSVLKGTTLGSNAKQKQALSDQNGKASISGKIKIEQDLVGESKADSKFVDDLPDDKLLQTQIFAKMQKPAAWKDKLSDRIQSTSEFASTTKLASHKGLQSNGLVLDEINPLTATSSQLVNASASFAALDSANSIVASHLQANANSGNLSGLQAGLTMGRDFSPNLAMRVQWMFQQAVNSAEIMMDPPELGPLTVKLHNQNGETNVIFHVNNAHAKDLIEANLAKLKELLADQGLSLGDAQVEQQKQQEKQSGYKNTNGNQPLDHSNSETLEANQSIVHQGLLDTYI